jgi:hypothetical protein
LACIGHDLNHPGLGNTYFQKSNHSISQTVNGKSVLENFHSYTLFRLFDETKLLTDLNSVDYKAVIGNIQEMILDTDMTKHSSLVQKLNSLQDLSNDLSPSDRLVVMSSIMHAADISNPAMPFKDFRDWGLRMT